jgi:hypothetical protein
VRENTWIRGVDDVEIARAASGKVAFKDAHEYESEMAQEIGEKQLQKMAKPSISAQRCGRAEIAAQSEKSRKGV